MFTPSRPALPTCFWRSVGPGHNIFVVESFVDELAHAAGQDPVAFRRAHLAKEPRLLACLDLAAEKAGWGGALPARVGRGVACQSVFGSYVAAIVEAEVDADGEIAIRRVTAAVDCGTVVNPDSVEAQIQGGLIFGLTAALYNEITIAKGRVQQSNFNNYRMMRINEAPAIEVHLIRNGEAPGGIGEPGTSIAAPALANALFAATGVRLPKPARRSQAARAEESRVRTVWRILIAAAALVAVAALGFVGWNVFGPGPTGFRGPRPGRARRLQASRSDRTFRRASRTRASSTGGAISSARPIARPATRRSADSPSPAGGRSSCPSARSIRPTSRPTRRPASASTAMRSFSRPSAAASGATARRLYPAMPFASYTYLTDADALAIKAYLFSLEPINAPAIPNTFAFPFDQRWAMGDMGAHVQRRPAVRAARRPERRVEPRRLSGRGARPLRRMPHAAQSVPGARRAAQIRRRGHRRLARLNITSDPTSGVGDWTAEALAHYLATGHAEGRGTAAGPMGEAVDLSLVHLTSEDIAAMVAYLRTVPPIANPTCPRPGRQSAIAAHAPGQADIRSASRSTRQPARAVTDGRARARSPASRRSRATARSTIRPASMSRKSSCSAAAGSPAKPGMAMPAFGDAYSDAEIAAVANYVTARLGAASRLTPEKVAALRLTH